MLCLDIHKHSFIGEDRTYGGNTLYIDMIPDTCFGISACNLHPAWPKIRTIVRERVDNICECCGEKASDAHERWSYDLETKQRKLIRLVALCKMCHAVTHWGRSKELGMKRVCKKHLMKVNHLEKTDTENRRNEG